MNDKLTTIGKYNEDFNNYLPYNIKPSNIFQSSGLEKHIIKRHPDCLKYIGFIPQIIANPDYIGINPNEKVTSFELVKCISENVQIGIKLDAKDNYLYVATLHTITDSKLKVTFHTHARFRHNAEIEKNVIHHQQTESAELWIDYSPTAILSVFFSSLMSFCIPGSVFYLLFPPE